MCTCSAPRFASTNFGPTFQGAISEQVPEVGAYAAGVTPAELPHPPADMPRSWLRMVPENAPAWSQRVYISWSSHAPSMSWLQCSIQ
jgi:hypothetical protein